MTAEHKAFIERVARMMPVNECLLDQTCGILERELAPLLTAGQAMRESCDEKWFIAQAWDAALEPKP